MNILWQNMPTFVGSKFERFIERELQRFAVRIIVSSPEMIGSRAREFAIRNSQGAEKPCVANISTALFVANRKNYRT